MRKGLLEGTARNDSSELKLCAVLFGNCPLHRLNLSFDSRSLITSQSFHGRRA
jgi:hypothetical protein